MNPLPNLVFKYGDQEQVKITLANPPLGYALRNTSFTHSHNGMLPKAGASINEIRTALLKATACCEAMKDAAAAAADFRSSQCLSEVEATQVCRIANSQEQVCTREINVLKGLLLGELRKEEQKTTDSLIENILLSEIEELRADLGIDSNTE